MKAFVFRRLLATFPVVLGVCTLTFFLIHMVPGDPVDIMLGDQASVMDKQTLRRQLNLNQPVWRQYTDFIYGLIRFDLGQSIQSRQPVATEILERLPATLELTLMAMLIAILTGVPLGVLAAVKRSTWWDKSVLVSSLLGMSLPSFWLGPMLILVFAIQLNLLPVSERGSFEHLILPSITLAAALSAILMRMTRSNMLDVIHQDYVQVARSKGLPRSVVFFKHALANAIMPVITIIGLQFGYLLTGTIITETIFDWPGIGTLLFEAIQQRNYPLVQGCVLFIALTYVLVNLLTDLAYALANPKVRLT